MDTFIKLFSHFTSKWTILGVSGRGRGHCSPVSLFIPTKMSCLDKSLVKKNWLFILPCPRMCMSSCESKSIWLLSTAKLVPNRDGGGAWKTGWVRVGWLPLRCGPPLTGTFDCSLACRFLAKNWATSWGTYRINILSVIDSKYKSICLLTGTECTLSKLSCFVFFSSEFSSLFTWFCA